jgi:hypothetical protein
MSFDSTRMRVKLARIFLFSITRMRVLSTLHCVSKQHANFYCVVFLAMQKHFLVMQIYFLVAQIISAKQTT